MRSIVFGLTLLALSCQPQESTDAPRADITQEIMDAANDFVAGLASLDGNEFIAPFTDAGDLVYVDGGRIYPDRDALQSAATGFMSRQERIGGTWDPAHVVVLGPDGAAFTGVFHADVVDTAGPEKSGRSSTRDATVTGRSFRPTSRTVAHPRREAEPTGALGPGELPHRGHGPDEGTHTQPESTAEGAEKADRLEGARAAAPVFAEDLSDDDAEPASDHSTGQGSEQGAAARGGALNPEGLDPIHRNAIELGGLVDEHLRTFERQERTLDPKRVGPPHSHPAARTELAQDQGGNLAGCGPGLGRRPYGQDDHEERREAGGPTA